jgi:hypothetical protein
MSTLNFHMKPSIQDFGEDLSDDAFVWASRSIKGRNAMEEFVSCGVWPLAGDVTFEHVKVDLTPVSNLKVPLPRFSLSRKDEEDGTRFLARVEQKARNIVDSYTCVEHEAYVSCLPNNCRLNHVLELTGVAYRPRPAPVPTEVLKKRKAYTSGKVLAKRSKAPKKKVTEPANVSGARTKGSHFPRIAPDSHGSLNLIGALCSKASGRGLGSKTMPRAKKIAPSAKKCIVPAIGDLATMSSEETQESSPHDQSPEVQSKAGLHGGSRSFQFYYSPRHSSTNTR